MNSAAEGASSLPGWRRDVLLLGAVLLVAAARFSAFLAGGEFAFRDGGTFFLPLREVLSRLLRAGEFPAWNEWVSHGRALAANPNGAVFWPLSPLLAALNPSTLVLVHLALVLVGFFAALRRWGLPAAGAAAGAATLLFSGVFQTLPILFTTLASALPLPLAVVALSRVGEEGRSLREAGLAALALGVSALGGEPVVTALGFGAGGLVVIAGAAEDVVQGQRRRLARRMACTGAALLLGGGLAAVQALPALEEFGRSARRAAVPAEHGVLFWSVPPARLLTLLEPRLAGDPFAEDPGDFWGGAVSDAGNPYFYDLAVGLVPLAFALSAAGRRQGRNLLLLGAAGAVVASGRFLPAFAPVAAKVSFLRYPEKGWILATFALAAAVAVGVALVLDPEKRGPALRRLSLVTICLASATGLLLTFSRFSPVLLRRLLWGAGLGAGETPPARVAALLAGPLAAGTASLLLVALVSVAVAAGRLSGRVLAAVVVLLFLADGARRVAGTCPATDAARLRVPVPETRAVLAEMPRGRFYDDGADRLETAVRRVAERGGLDPLRPATGVLAGVRYAGENDVDRMTSLPSFAWTALLARLPWGPEKVERLRAAGVSVARTSDPPAGEERVSERARFGADRIVAIEGARAEFELLPAGRLVPRGASLPFFPGVPVVEVDGEQPGFEPFDPGTVRLLERRSSSQRLDLSPAPGRRLLFVARTFDRNWQVLADGLEVRLLRADGFLSAVLLPAGTREVVFRYESRANRQGAFVSAISAAAVLLLILVPARGRS